MSEPARHDGMWDELQAEQENRKAGRNAGVSRVEPDRELPAQATPSELGEWPIRSIPPSQKQAADRAGYALGSAAARARKLGTRVQNHVHGHFDDLRSRFRVIRGRASANAQGTTEGLKRDAKRNLRHWRSRGENLARDYPIHFVAGAAAAAFVVGFLLGWWREDHE